MMRQLVVTSWLVSLVIFPVGADAAGQASASKAKEQPQELFQARKARYIHHLEADLECARAANNVAEMKNCREVAWRRQQEEGLDRIQNQRRRLEEREKKIRSKPQPAGITQPE